MFDREALAKRDVLGSRHIPYFRHIDGETTALAGGELLSIIELEGLPFEAVDMDDINAHDRGLNALWLNLADDAVMLWSLTIRRRVSEYPQGAFTSPFAQRLDDRYRERLNRTELYRNRLFLAVLRASDSGPGSNWLASLMGRMAGGGSVASAAGEVLLIKHKETVQGVASGLSRVGARVLGLVEHDGVMCSEIAAVLHWLVGGRMEYVPLTTGPVWSAVYQDRLVFGGDTVEIRHPERTRYAGVYGLKEYPSACSPTMMDELLTVPFEMTAVQSWRFVGKSTAREILKRRSNQLASANDGARKQVPLLAHALGELQDNKFTFGEHQASVTIFADSGKQLGDHMAAARNALMHGGAVVTREDMGLEAAWWAQLPGNAKYRCRRGYITSRNFSSLSAFHGYPKGRRDGNHWGPAVALLRTSSGAPFYFSWHVGELGNTFICGPSGSGKTVVLNFLLAQSLKHAPRIVVMDKDRGCELFVRAVGGTYFSLNVGTATGCAPLKALEINEKSLGWFCRWVESLAGGTLSPQERASVPIALKALAQVPRGERSLSGLLMYLDTTDAGGLAARLGRWVRGEPNGWVFDGDVDNISLDAQVLGFDMTEVLDIPEIRGPLMDYLFHRVEALLDGQRVLIAIDEFWKALEDEGFRAFVQDHLKTIRKKNGAIIFATQSPRDALRSPISHTIIEQCATQIYMPNGRADPVDYRQGMKLGPREFSLVSSVLTSDSRRFLIKQDQASVVVELNLSGFTEELDILSGRAASVLLLDELRAEVGDDPAHWLHLLHQQMRAA